MLLVTVLAIVIYNFFEHDIKYEAQTLNVSLENFKDKWGKPTKQIIYKTDIVLFYNSNIIGGDYYVFKFDYNTKNLKSKFYDE
jgi:hypothetical protein